MPGGTRSEYMEEKTDWLILIIVIGGMIGGIGALSWIFLIFDMLDSI
jgi:hypothetical protein